MAFKIITDDDSIVYVVNGDTTFRLGYLMGFTVDESSKGITKLEADIKPISMMLEPPEFNVCKDGQQSGSNNTMISGHNGDININPRYDNPCPMPSAIHTITSIVNTFEDSLQKAIKENQLKSLSELAKEIDNKILGR